MHALLLGVGVSVSLLAQAAAPPGPAPAAKVAADAKKLLTAYEATGFFSGAILVARGDEVLFSGAAGMADRELAVPNRTDTPFRICNISQLVTAAAILRLQEQGKLRVDDPVGRHMRNWPEAYHPITIHQLLTGQSGVKDVTQMPAFVASVAVPRATQELALMIVKEPPVAPPGTWSRAANSNYHLLAAIIDQISGRSFEQYVREEILARAGLTHTWHDDPAEIIPGRASGYTQSGGDIRNAAWFHMNNAVGMASLVSTVGDVHKLLRAIVNARVLNRESLVAMTTAHVPGTDLGGGARSPGTAYGLNVFRTDTRSTWNIGGSINGFVASFQYDENTQDTVIVLSNVAGGGGPFNLVNGLVASLQGRDPHVPVKRTATPPRPDDLRQLAGEWDVPNSFTITASGGRQATVLRLRVDGERLFGSSGGQEYELFASGPGEFFALHSDQQVLIDAASGRVTQVVSGRRSELTRRPAK